MSAAAHRQGVAPAAAMALGCPAGQTAPLLLLLPLLAPLAPQRALLDSSDRPAAPLPASAAAAAGAVVRPPRGAPPGGGDAGAGRQAAAGRSAEGQEEQAGAAAAAAATRELSQDEHSGGGAGDGVLRGLARHLRGGTNN